MRTEYLKLIPFFLSIKINLIRKSEKREIVRLGNRDCGKNLIDDRVMEFQFLLWA